MQRARTLVCSCCGRYYREEDGSVEEEGAMCGPCIEWASDLVMAPRIKAVEEALNPENAAKFRKMNKLQKEHVVFELYNRGVIRDYLPPRGGPDANSK